MQIIRTAADAATVPDLELRRHILEVFETVSDCPEILGFVALVEAGDTIAMLDTQLGFSVMANRQEFIQEHARHFELMYVLGQDGFGFDVFLRKDSDLPDLLAMCVELAVKP